MVLNNNKVMVQINIDTLTTLLAGMYIHYSETHVDAIPMSLWYELAEKLSPYLRNWDYDKCTFEQWISKMLLILPKIMIPDSELAYMKAHNEIYIEYHMCNAVLICTAPVIIGEVNAQ